MLINFIQSPDQDPSNKWRNIFAIVVVVLGVGFSVGPNIGLNKSVVEASNRIFPKFVADYVPKNVVGGDITVEPPRVLPPPPSIPALIGELPLPENFTAHSIFVKDKASNKVLYAKDEYSPRPIASITKLMSALVLLENPIHWTSSTVVVEGDLVDNHMYAGEVYTNEQLWNAGLIASSNKAIMSLVVGTGWDETQFVARMNEKALELGMTHTQFVEPTGLDEKNVSTASDVALLLNAALDKKEIAETVLEKEYTLSSSAINKSHHMWTTNWLLLNWVPQNSFEIIGGKTGYINASGYNFAVEVKNDAGKEISVVVLGADTHEGRFTEARDVAKDVFAAFAWPDEKE